MKGKATIQLLDSETKEVVYEKVEENYFTNFINNAYNMSKKYLGLNQVEFIKNFKFNDCVQGIMLLGTTQPVDASSNKFYLNTSDTVIGYAYDVYSGADTKRGTLNELESVYLASGYRKVWDFGTNIAVGSIEAIALTTAEGGSFDKTDICEPYLLFYEGASDGGSGNSYYGTHYGALSEKYAIMQHAPINVGITGTWDTDKIYILNMSGNIPIDYHTISNTKLVEYERATDYYENSGVARKFTITQSTPTGYTLLTRPDIDDDYVYVLYYDLGVGLKIHRYSTTTLAYVDELTYNFSLTQTPWFFMMTTNYVMIGDYSTNSLVSIQKSSPSENSITNSITGNVMAYGRMVGETDKICAIITPETSNDSTPYVFLKCDLTSDTIYDKMDIIFNRSYSYYKPHNANTLLYDNGRIIFFRGESNSTSKHTTMVLGCYSMYENKFLTTINNITTVTKGSSQILKVIYDITW